MNEYLEFRIECKETPPLPPDIYIHLIRQNTPANSDKYIQILMILRHNSEEKNDIHAHPQNTPQITPEMRIRLRTNREFECTI